MVGDSAKDDVRRWAVFFCGGIPLEVGEKAGEHGQKVGGFGGNEPRGRRWEKAVDKRWGKGQGTKGGGGR